MSVDDPSEDREVCILVLNLIFLSQNFYKHFKIFVMHHHFFGENINFETNSCKRCRISNQRTFSQ